MSFQDSLIASKILADAGMDSIEVSGGGHADLVKSKADESYFRDYAMELSQKISADIILTGGNRSLSVMQEIAENSRVRYFGFSRPLVSDPEFISKLCPSDDR